MATKQLRFAPLIRVSTEKQANKGESLRTQSEQIASYAKKINGVIPAELKERYSGQEHATPENERQKFDLLLSDASKDMFDAVIVCDVSRWSRDNLKSKKGLEVLRKNKIRFFCGAMELDLNKPDSRFILGMQTEINAVSYTHLRAHET